MSQFVCDRERGTQPVIFNDSTTGTGFADLPGLGQTQSVASLRHPAQIFTSE